MLKTLKPRLLALVNRGIEPGIRSALAKKIRTTNAICLVLFAITLPYAVIFLAIGAPWWLAAMIIPIAAAYLSFIFCNGRGWYYVSRTGFITCFNAAITLYSVALGVESGIHLLFFPLACLSLILFERRDWIFVAWTAGLPVVMYMTILHRGFDSFDTPPLAMRTLIQDFLVPTTFAILLASVFYLQLTNDAAEEDLAAALALREAETARSHQILDAITDMIILKGEQSVLLWGNKAFRDYYGLSNAQIEGLIDAPHVAADLTKKYVRDDLQVIESGKILVIEEEQAVRYDGCVRLFTTIKVPLKDAAGKATMLVCVCRDITGQRESERIISDQKAQMAVSAKLSALGEMAGGIAHEINTPLGIITMRASHIRRLLSLETIDRAKVADFCRIIEETGERIARIVHGLRTFSRTGDSDPHVAVSIKSIVDDTLALCSEKAKQNGVVIDVVAVVDDLEIECRAVEISQVLLNLISNALDAISESEQKWLKIAVKDCGAEIELTVSDSGSGIPPAVRQKMFHPFFTTKPVGKGTGLGLSVSKGIVEGHCGSLKLDETQPHTCFALTLPKRQALPAA